MDIRRVAPRDASLAPCSVASLFPPSGVLMPYDRVGQQFQPLGDYVLRDYVRGVRRAASPRARQIPPSLSGGTPWPGRPLTIRRVFGPSRTSTMSSLIPAMS